MEPDSGLRSLILSLTKRDDEFWHRYTLKKDLYFKKLQPDEKENIIKKSVETAEEVYAKILKDIGKLDPESYVNLFGLKLERVEDDVILEYLYLALYSASEKKITINQGALELINSYILENNLEDIIDVQEIEKVAIMHELFHHLEEETPGIYTRSKMLKRKFLNTFGYNKGIYSSSEIGAIHFSKISRGLRHSPCIYEILILHLTGQDIMAKSLLEEY